jgi:hypothetical protein
MGDEHEFDEKATETRTPIPKTLDIWLLPLVDA